MAALWLIADGLTGQVFQKMVLPLLLLMLGLGLMLLPGRPIAAVLNDGAQAQLK